MLYSILAGLICTTSSVNPDNSRYFTYLFAYLLVIGLLRSTQWC